LILQVKSHTVYFIIHSPTSARGTIQVSLSRQQSGCTGVDGNAFSHVQPVFKAASTFYGRWALAKCNRSEI